MSRAPEIITGSPYSAEFIVGEDGSIGHSDATVIIEPPVHIGDTDNIALSCIFDQFPVVTARVNHLVTTLTKTVIEIEVTDRYGDPTDGRENSTYEHRIQVAREGTQAYVAFLNRVEAGTFDGYTFNTLED